MSERKTESYSLFSNISKADIGWLWYPFIPCGKITILQGDPGDGKSTMMMDIIAKLTTGRRLPDGRILAPMNVIYQCSEDGLADTIKPRLEKAKADCKRVGYIDEDLFGLSLDDEKIRTAIIDMNARLLVIDPFQAYVGDADLSSATGMRKILRRLSMWSSACNCAVVLVGHLNKRSGSKELYRGLGSIDVVAAARSVIQIDLDDENPDVRIVKHIKSSLAPKGINQRFSLDSSGCVKWDDFTTETGLVDLREKLIHEEPKSKQEQAAQIMCKMLADGPMEATKVENSLLEKGISSRTVKMAKKLIAVESKRKNKVWYWCLPTKDGKYPEITETEEEDDE